MFPTRPSPSRLALPDGERDLEITVGRKKLRLTGLDTLLWPELHITKRDLLQHYIDFAPALLPHLKDRAIAMPAMPPDRPSWIRTVAGCPIVQDLGSLLWILNEDCLDLRPSYARCDDGRRPDHLQFELETFESALRARDALGAMGIACYAKTSGSRGIHLCAPIKRGPDEDQARRIAEALARQLPGVRPAPRPLAAVYSVRPHRLACVSTPVTWEEVERGFRMEEFRLDTIAQRVRDVGDLWKPLTLSRGRADLTRVGSDFEELSLRARQLR